MKITKTASLFATVFAGSILAFASSLASATTVIDAAAAIQAGPGASGLTGTYWHVPAWTTNYNVADTLAARDSAAATGTFTSSSLAYYGGDGSSIVDFLGADGSSYAGSNTDLGDGILEFKGFIWINAPRTINFGLNHDDAAQLSIGNQVLISQGCCGYQAEDAVFSQAGMYAIDLVYANTYYYGFGGAIVELSADGQMLRDNLYQNVPEPGSAALMLIGALGLLGAAAHRRKSNKI
jgi:hypothetical protein